MSAVRVLLDATSIPADRGGVGRYVEELVGALDSVDLVVACQTRDAERFARLAPTATIRPQSPRISSVARRLLWEQAGLPRLARREKVTVIHSPHYTVPVLTRIPRVVTFHDATFFSDPHVHTQGKRWFFRLWIRLSARLARIAVVPSRATAEELRRWARVRTVMRVAPHGVDRRLFHPPSTDARRSLAHRLRVGSWIAFLGTIEPRKNVPALVRAYGMLLEAGRDDPPALVLAGARGWDDEVEDAIAALPGGAQVVLPGYLSADDLPALLGGAELVAYPSLGEGFGLPVLEAMACAAPVVTTRRLALPEVGGDAVAYAEPDAASLAATMAELLDDPRRRESLGRAALERSRVFTWSRAAEIHAEAWREAVG